jgi:heat shock protein HslJ
MKTLFQIAGVIVLVSFMGACKAGTFCVEEQPGAGSTKALLSGATTSTEGITGIYWKLVEINGKPVKWDGKAEQEAFILLKDEDNLFTGNGGCNTLFGTYEIDRTTNSIKFSKMASTLMACRGMEIETELKRALEMADNYSLSADEKYLSLNKASMASLARFEAINLNSSF